jgi:hypothetical protein
MFRFDETRVLSNEIPTFTDRSIVGIETIFLPSTLLKEELHNDPKTLLSRDAGCDVCYSGSRYPVFTWSFNQLTYTDGSSGLIDVATTITNTGTTNITGFNGGRI